MKLHPEVALFAKTLRQITDLLAENGEEFWCQEVGRCLNAVEKSDAWGLHRFLNSSGGMGSFNDLVLNGSNSDNDKLYALRSVAYQMARQLKKSDLDTSES